MEDESPKGYIRSQCASRRRVWRASRRVRVQNLFTRDGVFGFHVAETAVSSDEVALIVGAAGDTVAAALWFAPFFPADFDASARFQLALIDAGSMSMLATCCCRSSASSCAPPVLRGTDRRSHLPQSPGWWRCTSGRSRSRPDRKRFRRSPSGRNPPARWWDFCRPYSSWIRRRRLLASVCIQSPMLVSEPVNQIALTGLA